MAELPREPRFETGVGRLLATNPIDPKAREFVLLKATVTIGSDEANDLVIRDGTVSRRHAVISFGQGRLEIRDLGSTNGTFVNGQRIFGSAHIDKGDKIRFGGADFVFLRTVVPATTTEPAAVAVVVPNAARYATAERTVPKLKRVRSVSLRAIGELVLIAFVVGFGTAQYLAYLHCITNRTNFSWQRRFRCHVYRHRTLPQEVRLLQWKPKNLRLRHPHRIRPLASQMQKCLIAHRQHLPLHLPRMREYSTQGSRWRSWFEVADGTPGNLLVTLH
jgi:pSer/pThr/pTyr-binding forkhead associated (FHA) protein